MPTFKETVQNNAVVFFLAAVVGSFVAGITAYNRGLEIFNQTTVPKDYVQSLEHSKQQVDAQLEESNRQNSVLQAKLKTAQSAGEAGHPTPVLTEYMHSVQAFSNAAPMEPYQWDGYKSDVDKLYFFIQEFLDYLRHNPKTSYRDSEELYAAIDEAASEVTLRAEKKFVFEKETGAGSDKILNYDQKVFVGTSWFRICLQEMRLAHEQGTVAAKLDDVQSSFVDWRNNKAGI